MPRHYCLPDFYTTIFSRPSSMNSYSFPFFIHSTLFGTHCMCLWLPLVCPYENLYWLWLRSLVTLHWTYMGWRVFLLGCIFLALAQCLLNDKWINVSGFGLETLIIWWMRLGLCFQGLQFSLWLLWLIAIITLILHPPNFFAMWYYYTSPLKNMLYFFFPLDFGLSRVTCFDQCARANVIECQFWA